MSEGKYIIIKRLGHEIPILFSSLIDHKEMAGGAKIIAAGFFRVEGIRTLQGWGQTAILDILVVTYGRSKSLSVYPRPLIDAELIKKMLEG